MNNEQYDLRAKPDAMTFEFTSVGPKGEIPKMVIYSKTPIENLYNLAFGDKDVQTGVVDNFVVTDNKDSLKVLATVAFTVYEFTRQYPNALIFATGSTNARTRLYQIGISNNLATITKDFDVLGLKNDIWEYFEKNTQYDAFIITLKKI